MLRSGRLSYNAQRNVNKVRPILGTILWYQKFKIHVQTAREFHDLNMGFVVWTQLLVHSRIASNRYVHRILCKNVALTSMQRHDCIDVDATLSQRCVPVWFSSDDNSCRQRRINGDATSSTLMRRCIDVTCLLGKYEVTNALPANTQRRTNLFTTVAGVAATSKWRY